MTGKEFTKQAKELGGNVKKTDSKYWGKVWWEATFESPVISTRITFEENQPVGVRVLGKNDSFANAEDLEDCAKKLQEISNFVRSINLV